MDTTALHDFPETAPGALLLSTAHRNVLRVVYAVVRDGMLISAHPVNRLRQKI